MKEKKKELRKQLAAIKRANSAHISQLSADVLAVLEANPTFRAANTILLYYALPDEVQTQAFVERWSSAKQLLLPVVVGDELEIRRYTGPQDLRRGAYGIDEPTGERFTAYDDIELVIVPGVAFDRKGHRLGRGKGYYDRLLPQLKRARRLGLCLPFQLVDEVPTEAFDTVMDEVISGR